MPADSPNPAPNPPLQSTLADDPDMAELVSFFVEEMGERVESINAAALDQDLSQLRTVAHQLKGAAGGYGFAPISDCAASLEQLIDASDPSADAEALREQVDALIDLCRRASL
ncbi:MAG: Hpt domain-containing protein [Phycisphaeraceae bacterium]